MNILITGGTGLIGRHLVLKLLSQDYRHITVLTRNVSNASKILPMQVQLVTQLSQAVIDQQDVIINLAGEPIANKRWSKSQKAMICQSRWQLTEQISQFIQQSTQPARCFISGSAIGVYGRQNKLPIDETFENIHHEFTTEVCQRWETLAMKASSNKTRVCLLRTGIVLDKKQGALAKMLPAFKLGLGGPIANGQQMMSWIHINDMVDAIIFIMHQSSISGAINVTSPNAVSNAQFSQTLGKVLSRPAVFPMPKFVVRLLFGEMSDLLVYGQNVVPKKLLSNGFSFQFSTLLGALHELLDSK